MAKKIMSAFIAVMLVICASAIPAFAADGPSAYVSISDKDGKLVLVLEKIDLSDADGDGTITTHCTLRTKLNLRAVPLPDTHPSRVTTVSRSPSFGDAKTAEATDTM